MRGGIVISHMEPPFFGTRPKVGESLPHKSGNSANHNAKPDAASN